MVIEIPVDQFWSSIFINWRNMKIQNGLQIWALELLKKYLLKF